jgi:hypothetical protein
MFPGRTCMYTVSAGRHFWVCLSRAELGRFRDTTCTHDLDFRSTKLLVTYCTRLHCIYICFSLCWPYNGPCYIFRFFFLPFLSFHFSFLVFQMAVSTFGKRTTPGLMCVCVDCAGQHLQKAVLVPSKEYKWPVVIPFSSSLWLNMIRNLTRPLQRESDSYTTIHRSFAGAGRLGGFYGRRENERRV